jgi:hypothetical protein
MAQCTAHILRKFYWPRKKVGTVVKRWFIHREVFVLAAPLPSKQRDRMRRRFASAGAALAAGAAASTTTTASRCCCSAPAKINVLLLLERASACSLSLTVLSSRRTVLSRSVRAAAFAVTAISDVPAAAMKE